ncbi:MAG: hypothetical protein V4616_11080 [Bacteroidota bacterium]
MVRTLLSLLFVSVFCTLPSFAQTMPGGFVKQSTVSTQGIGPDGEVMNSREGKATLMLDPSSGELRVIFDLSTFMIRYPGIDSLLENESDPLMVFSGNIGMNIFKLNEVRDDNRVYTINGDLAHQGKTYQVTALFDPISFSGAFDAANEMKVNFKMQVDTKLFYVAGFSDGGFSALTFEVAPGLVNIPH